MNETASAGIPVEILSRLTTKEVMVIEALADGESAKSIARAHNNSPRTIEKHIANIKVKLGVDRLSPRMIMLVLESVTLR
jgi:DNA-binding NarL/FixJ family response regulator